MLRGAGSGNIRVNSAGTRTTLLYDKYEVYDTRMIEYEYNFSMAYTTVLRYSV